MSKTEFDWLKALKQMASSRHEKGLFSKSFDIML